ncbi:hypothetical protein CEXT_476071 [Caerostris extrusa]|uniref:Uncharacterized protein n=1 Tax=Caerostris extrusa TaxID=172846 RepID=A0AAV4MDD3_CAEEX|nr:hypothetical protein CEXT_476071 [Caerostris extrusa]
MASNLSWRRQNLFIKKSLPPPLYFRLSSKLPAFEKYLSGREVIEKDESLQIMGYINVDLNNKPGDKFLPIHQFKSDGKCQSFPVDDRPEISISSFHFEAFMMMSNHSVLAF